MNRCPITYEPCGKDRYSRRGLRLLSRELQSLTDLPFTAVEQRQEAARRAGRMSIQGVQAKLSARLDVKNSRFEIVDTDGRFILKPPSDTYPELPENEDLTMRLATEVGIEVPLHGMVYAHDGSRTYFIRRFDRSRRHGRVAVEDFAQLSGKSRESKYDSSMERVAEILDYCTFPAVERRELFRRTLFCYLTGNEDMHLKNFSLITREGRITLAPAYDFLNTTIVLSDPVEIALPLKGKQRNLTRNDFVKYFGMERLELSARTIESVLADFARAAPECRALINRSFLQAPMRGQYVEVFEERRRKVLG